MCFQLFRVVSVALIPVRLWSPTCPVVFRPQVTGSVGARWDFTWTTPFLVSSGDVWSYREINRTRGYDGALVLDRSAGYGARKCRFQNGSCLSRSPPAC